MALDHPDRVERIALLDIVPTRKMFESFGKELATASYHWFFLIQAPDLPERMIGADPDYYLDQKLERWSAPGFQFAPAAVEEYRRCFRAPGTVHSTCEDYRAGASIDLEHDEADIDHRLACPLLALWGEQGRIAKVFDVLETWRERADDVRGRAVPGAHFPAEEAPRETLAELLPFLRA